MPPSAPDGGDVDAAGPAGDPSLHRALGLTDDEAGLIEEILGRPPNALELAMYAVMWSEHCSYKSSRLHLKRLPTEGERVLVGPGENAGVIDAGDGIAVALRIESHNHPSAVEPHQGAATGVGGILRDVFTMGARPIALMDPLFFGPPDDPRNRYLLEGVVGGISSYGNAVGVPTLGGELTFDPCYSRNPLVNVFCLGVLPVGRLVLGRASGEGNLAILLGSATGRDGIGGVSVLASAGFGGGEDDQLRPSVQVGDPYEEKRLIEACLALLDAGLVVGIQDLGGAGLTCATSETAARAGMGMDVFVSEVPRREPHMAPFEVMTSESQERMLAIVEPANEEAVLALCRRHEVRAGVAGVVRSGGRLRIFDRPGGEVLADVPASSLADDAPLYDRPLAEPAGRAGRLRATDPQPIAADDPDSGDGSSPSAGADLLALLAAAGDPSWVYRQYDHQLFLNTVVGPGRDAAVLRLAAPGLPPSERGIAVSCDSAPRWCSVDPRIGTAWIVAESAINVACAGAHPVALVNCLNFGNPEHPEVMWQLSEAVDGMAEASRALDIPVVGGNVSLYNEADGVDIDPTPVVAVLGLIDHLFPPPAGPASDGDALVLLGDSSPSLAGSRWAVELRDHAGGMLTEPDYPNLRSLVGLLVDLVADAGARRLAPALFHDVSGGGLAVALAEIALWSGSGLEVGGVRGREWLFAEAPGRVVVRTPDPDPLLARAAAARVPSAVLGRMGGDRLVVRAGQGPSSHPVIDLPLDDIRATWSGSLPGLLDDPVDVAAGA